MIAAAARKIKFIHFIGVKGVGMAPLAIIAKEAGYEVTGCDVGEEFITDVLLKKAGVTILNGFSADHLENVDQVIATGAHGGANNPETAAARQKQIPVLTQGEAVAKFQTGEFFGKPKFAISVAGSHGKTTTTAMISVVLKSAGLDPSYSIGTGYIPYLEGSGHWGNGKYFVVEADEYVVDAQSDLTPKFLLQKPDLILITNVDFDHPDIYSTYEKIENAFISFGKKLSVDKSLIVNGDGEKNREFIKKLGRKSITYGVSPANDYVISRVSPSDDQTFFDLEKDGQRIGEFVIKVFGEQNVLNATGAAVVCIELGLSIKDIKEGLAHFSGSKRRSEYIGQTQKGALVYDDYAHHPEEIKKTLSAFRKRFPKQNIICIFQPHMYSRTKVLLADFIKSFSDVNQVIIAEIFPSFREQRDPNFSARAIVQGVNKYSNKSTFFPNLTDVIKYLESNPPKQNDVVITMGAGDVYKVSQSLIIK